MPKVSVIIPSYNLAEYLAESIDSVLSQTFTDFEILVVDDGSEDNTKDVLKKYGKKIRYIYKENQGISSARNRGIQESVGEYLAFLDADDIWYPDKLRLQVEALDSNPDVAIIFTDSEEFNISGILRKSSRPTQSKSVDKNSLEYQMFSTNFNDGVQLKGYYYKDLVLGDPVRLSTVLIRKDILENIGSFDITLRVNQDYDFFIRASEKYNLLYFNKVTTRYRIRSDSVSGGWGEREFLYREHDANMLEKHFKKCSTMYRPLLKKRISENYRIVAWKYFQCLDLKKARKFCFKSLFYNKHQAKLYVYILVSFLPRRLINSLRNAKEWSYG